MISSSTVEKMFFHDFKLKCWKTQCFSMNSSSNVEKHNVFQWLRAEMLRNTMFFNDLRWNIKKIQCALTIPDQILRTDKFVQWFQLRDHWYIKKHNAFQWFQMKYPETCERDMREMWEIVREMWDRCERDEGDVK